METEQTEQNHKQAKEIGSPEVPKKKREIEIEINKIASTSNENNACQPECPVVATKPQPLPQRVPCLAANVRESERESERRRNENARSRSASRDRNQCTKKESSHSGNSFSRSLIVNRSNIKEAKITVYVMESAQFDLTTSNEDTVAAIRQVVIDRQVATFVSDNNKFPYESVNNAFLSGDINTNDIACYTRSDETARDMLKKPKYK